jgi:hypothetical protein
MEPNDILESQDRRRYHMVVGTLVFTAIYSAVLIGVRTVMS